ncbi:SCO2521 family protein [Actinocorallia longicatena]|uniref:SCO2521 family protein n=1 Tax=Actinocorallia longicatena TaxID=111803 RepID=A0ABP6QAP2_9ACTN
MSSRTASEGDLAVGEVRTGFLSHSRALSLEAALILLELVPGEQVRSASRPRAYAVSPEPLTGIDCVLPSLNGRRTRAVGTVASRVTLTGGRILQACSYAEIVRAGSGNRQAWSHYLSHPGVVETLGKLNAEDAAAGFAESERGSRGIEVGIIAEQQMNGVQNSPMLDGVLPVRARRGSWRWAFQRPEKGGGELFRFKILGDGTRLLRLALPDHGLDDVIDLVEDLALHDWLLSTVEEILERAQLGSGPPAKMLPLVRPVIDHVLHHWMPAARVKPELMPLWATLDRAQGFTRQWDLSVHRVRDQLALNTVTMLSAASDGYRADADEPALRRA